MFHQPDDNRTAFTLMALVAALIAAAFLSGCTAMPVQTLATNVFYQRDMGITVDGITRSGVLVAPKAASHQFAIEAKGDLDLFTFQTCHREISASEAYNPGWFSDKRHTDLTYTPIPGLEDTDSCVVLLGGYDKSEGQHSWGLVDFEDDDDTLPAQVLCNGENYQSNGVTVCQSRQGLIERIIFPVEVTVSPTPACPMPDAPDGKTFQFPLAPQVCVYAFNEVAPIGKQRRHRLTTLGYSGILVRTN